MTETVVNAGVTTRTADRVCWITIDAPPFNVMSTAIFRSLAAALAAADAAPGVAVIVLQGAGERAFSTGADIGDHTREAEMEHHAALFDLMARLLNRAGKPRIAAVRGYCYGGGIEVAFACDTVVACEDARFAMPEIKLGVLSTIGARMLMNHIAPARAFELAASGEPIDAHRAFALGMVGRLLPRDTFAEALGEYVGTFARHSAASLSVGRDVFYQSADLGALDAVALLRREIADRSMKTADYMEGMAAYMEKRAPRWRDA